MDFDASQNLSNFALFINRYLQTSVGLKTRTLDESVKFPMLSIQLNPCQNKVMQEKLNHVPQANQFSRAVKY
jgi:hypothetical protein